MKLAVDAMGRTREKPKEEEEEEEECCEARSMAPEAGPVSIEELEVATEGLVVVQVDCSE